MKLNDIIEAIDALAPPRLAWPDDPVGLHTGRSGGDDISALLVTLDVTPEVAAEADAAGAGMILAHHPLIYRPLKCLADATATQKTVRELIRRDIALYVAHTNLDAAPLGVCQALADAIGLTEIEPLTTSPLVEYKIVVFVPTDAVPAVSSAMCDAGAGRIGDYRDCTFSSPGTGSFTASADAKPAVGAPGEHTQTPELRLEANVGADRLPAVLDAVRRAHPYETPAVDVYPLAHRGAEPGIGRIGALALPMPLDALAAQVKHALDAHTVRVAGDADKPCRRVAVCGGSGGACLEDAIAAGCDAYVLGELGYHEAVEAVARGMGVIAAGHADTERIIIPKLAKILGQSLPGVKVMASKVTTDPWRAA